MFMRTWALSALGILLALLLPIPAQADWLYDWNHLPPGDGGTASDPPEDLLVPPYMTGRDIRAFAQFIWSQYGIDDAFWNTKAALYAVTDRANLFQAFRMDLKGEPNSSNYAPYYVIAIDGLPGEGVSMGGFEGIDRLIVSSWTGSNLGEPLLFKWTGSGFDSGTPFSLISGAGWQYGYWSTSNPPPYAPGTQPGYGYTLEWKLPIGQLGTGPFRIVGATAAGDFGNFTIYDITSGIDLGAASIIPEPSSVVLLGLGALGFLGYLARRRRG